MQIVTKHMHTFTARTCQESNGRQLEKGERGKFSAALLQHSINRESKTPYAEWVFEEGVDADCAVPREPKVHLIKIMDYE